MDTKTMIWQKLLGAGLTLAGAAGLMGNLYAESALRSDTLQNTYERKLGFTDETYTKAVDSGSYTSFANDAAGYGLAQWTYRTRKAALLAYAGAQGKSIGDAEMQTDFCIKELREGYPALWQTLTSTDSVQAASDAVLLQYERPADTSEKVRKLRAGFGERFLAELGAADANPVTPPCPAAETIEVRVSVNGKMFAGMLTEV